MQAATEAIPSSDVKTLLDDAAQMTDEIRSLQAKIKERGIERRKIILDLRQKNVTYKDIASSMGVTEQNIYKILNRPEF
jgi:DNA-directed RNA polymerase specialized sigma24 family protein